MEMQVKLLEDKICQLTNISDEEEPEEYPDAVFASRDIRYAKKVTKLAPKVPNLTSKVQRTGDWKQDADCIQKAACRNPVSVPTLHKVSKPVVAPETLARVSLVASASKASAASVTALPPISAILAVTSPSTSAVAAPAAVIIQIDQLLSTVNSNDISFYVWWP